MSYTQGFSVDDFPHLAREISEDIVRSRAQSQEAIEFCVERAICAYFAKLYTPQSVRGVKA